MDKGPISDEDFEFLKSLLGDLSRWLVKKGDPAKDAHSGMSNPDQIWRANMMPRDPSDPMGNFIAKMGEA